MTSLGEIRRVLAAHDPQCISLENSVQAAIALVLRDTAFGPELLFIERAEREGDPWSGHMALPGGRFEPDDAHVRETAERETFEEVGLRLDSAEHLGRLDDKQGNPRAQAALVISALVYRVDPPVSLRLNHEVRAAFWFPVAGLLDPERRVAYASPRLGLNFPGILVGEPQRHVVWGLTYRFLESFFELLGRPLPKRRPEALHEASADAS